MRRYQLLRDSLDCPAASRPKWQTFPTVGPRGLNAARGDIAALPYFSIIPGLYFSFSSRFLKRSSSSFLVHTVSPARLSQDTHVPCRFCQCVFFPCPWACLFCIRARVRVCVCAFSILSYCFSSCHNYCIHWSFLYTDAATVVLEVLWACCQVVATLYNPFIWARQKYHVLICDIYHLSLSVSFSLPQADQLMFAMHFVKGMYPDLFQENVSMFCICIF